MKRFFPIAGLALSLLSACFEKESRVEQLAQAVWSDNGQSQAVVIQRFDQTSTSPLDGSTAIKQNLTHQIYVQQANGTGRQAVANEFQGENARELYYMQDAGYIIGSWVDAADPQNPVIRYYKLGLDGKVKRLTDKPDMKILPSPDGRVLAELTLYPATCSNPGGNCPVEVHFLDAQTLEPLTKKISLRFDGPAQPAWSWLPNGTFVVQAQKAFLLTPGSETSSETALLTCLNPATSSSAHQTQGVLFIEANQVKQRPLAANEPVFGCQLNPQS